MMRLLQVARTVLLACSIAFMPVAALAQATPQLPPMGGKADPSMTMTELGARATGKISSGDFAGAEPDLLKIIEMKDFEVAPDNFRSAIFLYLGLVETGLGRPAEGLK